MRSSELCRYESYVWVLHPELGYSAGRIVETMDDGRVRVICEDGHVCVTDRSECTGLHPNALQGVPDLLELGEFSLAGLLNNIRVRYLKGEYYSSIGMPILISVNPYKNLPDLYSPFVRKQYQNANFITKPPASSPSRPNTGSSGASVPVIVGGTGSLSATMTGSSIYMSRPHLFGTAQITYSNLMRNRKAQSIVVSGESGAGKTEATKIILKYLSELDSGAADEDSKSSYPSTPTPFSGRHPLRRPFSPLLPKRRHGSIAAHNSVAAVLSPLIGSAGGGMLGANSVLGASCVLGSGPPEAGGIELHTLRSNPILESFGNAKTLRNDNSSRFGKFIQVFFDLRTGRKIRLAKISHYLLEKCRLVSLHPNERNFHIFYLLLFGSQNTEWVTFLEKSKLDQPLLFRRILGNDDSCWIMGKEEALFKELIECLESTGFSNEDIEQIFTIIASLCHLSNLSFSALREEGSLLSDGPLATLDNPEVLDYVISLLQILPPSTHAHTHGHSPTPAKAGGTPKGETPNSKVTRDSFLQLLLFRRLHNAEASGSWIMTGRDLESVLTVRDSIVKEIYSRLFEWLVRKINKTLCSMEEADKTRSAATALLRSLKDGPGMSSGPGAGGGGLGSSGLTGSGLTGETPTCYPPIGLLDIYGFEVFEGRNSFEQLCINYANEKLQQHFNHHVLDSEQRIYRDEGINWREIQFTDNKRIIDSLEARPDGIFVILDDARVNAKDHWFLQEVQRRAALQHSNIVIMPPPSSFKKMSFTIKHYAGDVEYDCTGFVEKNQDRLHHDFSYFIGNSSKLTLMNDLFPNLPNLILKNSLTSTVSMEFRNQLNGLLRLLTATTPTYVRCIKPNDQKAPNKFDSLDVLRQLKYAGLLESIRIRNSGFGVRSTYDEFLDKYGLLESTVRDLWRVERHSLPLKERGQMCRRILTSILSQNDRATWQLGATKVFMKEEAQIQLEKCRLDVLSYHAVNVQRRIRGAMGRMLASQRLALFIKVQAVIRGFLQRRSNMRHQRMVKSATRLQAAWRGHRARVGYKEMKRRAYEACARMEADPSTAESLGPVIVTRHLVSGRRQRGGENKGGDDSDNSGKGKSEGSVCEGSKRGEDASSFDEKRRGENYGESVGANADDWMARSGRRYDGMVDSRGEGRMEDLRSSTGVAKGMSSDSRANDGQHDGGRGVDGRSIDYISLLRKFVENEKSLLEENDMLKREKILMKEKMKKLTFENNKKTTLICEKENLIEIFFKKLILLNKILYNYKSLVHDIFQYIQIILLNIQYYPVQYPCSINDGSFPNGGNGNYGPNYHGQTYAYHGGNGPAYHGAATPFQGSGSYPNHSFIYPPPNGYPNGSNPPSNGPNNPANGGPNGNSGGTYYAGGNFNGSDVNAPYNALSHAAHPITSAHGAPIRHADCGHPYGGYCSACVGFDSYRSADPSRHGYSRNEMHAHRSNDLYQRNLEVYSRGPDSYRGSGDPYLRGTEIYPAVRQPDLVRSDLHRNPSDVCRNPSDRCAYGAYVREYGGTYPESSHHCQNVENLLTLVRSSLSHLIDIITSVDLLDMPPPSQQLGGPAMVGQLPFAPHADAILYNDVHDLSLLQQLPSSTAVVSYNPRHMQSPTPTHPGRPPYSALSDEPLQGIMSSQPASTHVVPNRRVDSSCRAEIQSNASTAPRQHHGPSASCQHTREFTPLPPSASPTTFRQYISTPHRRVEMRGQPSCRSGVSSYQPTDSSSVGSHHHLHHNRILSCNVTDGGTKQPGEIYEGHIRGQTPQTYTSGRPPKSSKFPTNLNLNSALRGGPDSARTLTPHHDVQLQPQPLSADRAYTGSKLRSTVDGRNQSGRPVEAGSKGAAYGSPSRATQTTAGPPAPYLLLSGKCLPGGNARSNSQRPDMNAGRSELGSVAGRSDLASGRSDLAAQGRGDARDNAPAASRTASNPGRQVRGLVHKGIHGNAPPLSSSSAASYSQSSSPSSGDYTPRNFPQSRRT